MKSLFIKGTNEQYSIREDGEVTSHIKVIPKVLKHSRIRNIIGVSIRFNKISRFLSINKLLVTYFGFCRCKYCNNKIYQPKDTSKPTTVCMTCRKEITYNCGVKYNNANRNLINAKNRIYTKQQTLQLTDKYIHKSLVIPSNTLSQEIITTKRQQLLLHRQCKTINL